MAKHILWLFLMLSLFSCFRKKTQPKTIEPWLEQQFPGQFEVLISNLKILDVMAQFRGEKRALVADKADPDVQFFLNWEKGAESLGLNPQTVTKARERARTEVAAARDWFGRLQKVGLERFSVGVVGESLTVQVFGEPTETLHMQTLDHIRAAQETNPGPAPNVVIFEILEPAAFQTEYRDIIPRGHWEAGTGWQRKNLILSLRLEPSGNTPSAWEYNTESGRCAQYRQDAFRHAKAWADKNLPQPFFMDESQASGIEHVAQGKQPQTLPALRFSFPFFEQAPADSLAEPAGYVSGLYSPEKQTFTDVRKQREY